MNKIYDCFLFFNELDLLEIRLNVLNSVVDYFVIVESTVTFSGKSKKLFFDENKNNFKDFEDKIIHIIIDDTPENFIKIQNSETQNFQKNKILKYLEESKFWNKNEKQWGREIYQRESMINGLLQCDDHDMIIFSDADEIPNPLCLKNLDHSKVYELKQNMFYYNVNTLKERFWSGSKIISWQKIKNNSINDLRQNKLTTEIVENGGWHLSFMGGKERIIEKLDAYSHQEYNNPYIISNIEKNISNNTDLFFNPKNFETVNGLDHLPEIMKNLIENKFPYLIK